MSLMYGLEVKQVFMLSKVINRGEKRKQKQKELMLKKVRPSYRGPRACKGLLVQCENKM